jgi:hypothetical protein
MRSAQQCLALLLLLLPVVAHPGPAAEIVIPGHGVLRVVAEIPELEGGPRER